MRSLSGAYVNAPDPRVNVIPGLPPIARAPVPAVALMPAGVLTDAQAFALATQWHRRVVTVGDPAPLGARPAGSVAGSLPFTALNPANTVLPAVAAEVVVVSFTVPAGRNCSITRLANQLITGGWNQGTGQLSWRIQVDKQAVQGYSNLNSSVGTVALPKDLTEAPILARENQLVELILLNNSLAVGGSNPVLGLLGGFFWPMTEEETGAW